MLPKKLCSLGVLDININLILRKSQAEEFNFYINKYNSIEDLEDLFFKNNIENKNNKFKIEENVNVNYMDYISLSSDNNLIIEFIMLNQMELSDSTKFVQKMIQEIFDKNYFFINEIKILYIPSKIKFIINILNDNDDKIIYMKSFELFEINEIELEQININNDVNDDNLPFKNKDDSFLYIDKLNYNFIKTDYFLFDLGIIKDFKLPNNQNYSNFILEIIKRNPKIKIILIVDEIINNIEEKYLKLNKKLIELSDIIFSFRDILNNFFQIYNLTLNNNLKDITFNSHESFYNSLNVNLEIIGNKKLDKYDLIITDQDKYRKNIPRLLYFLKNLIG